ncbi:SIR2 family NAD-dependent protein deacylase [Flavobacterium soyae]|uniref:SIR2 family NAD-dependent protein deacylase n=1 Tax=Flavobacterium soyae TaxID=2903098 RepID=UPI001E62AA85|nr:SIR2 family protein [Flavobacterium soyae]MCD9575072.1 SIR2 family protein [Flavobacterium soyae]
MAKERIFELIRNEEVVLFVGAGMSMYAGCPSGAKLAEILHNGLTEELKKDITLNYDLSKLAEEICNIKGGNKNYLFSTLKKEFQKIPLSTETHQLLARIPHFKNIITTNYDTLIESTNNNIEVIRKSADYTIVDPKKQLLFKIHSDLSDTENIILTTTDYNNYFSKSKEDSVFWNAIKDRLASNHILFIGYGMEDSNINVLLDKIIQELGHNRKEIFFVSPSIPPAKLKYFQRIGIEYIESTGENFINEIYEDLRLNYFPNLTKGVGVAGTALDFANANQINVTLSQKDKRIEIGDIKSTNEISDHKIEVKFEMPTSEESMNILASIKGKNFEDVYLDKNSLKEFNMFFKGFRFKTEEDIQNLIIKKLPVFDFNMHIIFEDGFEIDNYPFKLFVISPSENEGHLKIQLEDFTVIIKIEFQTEKDSTKYNLEIFPSEQIRSTNSGFKFYEMLYKIISGQKFKIYKENEIFYNYIPKIKFEDDALDAKLLLKYFEDLKKIEKHFNLKFSKINLEKKFEKLIKNILAYIDKTSFSEHFLGESFGIEGQKNFEQLISIDEGNLFLTWASNKKTIIDLYDKQFDLGYLHTSIHDGYIENLKDLQLSKTKNILLKSRSELIHFRYADDKNII